MPIEIEAVCSTFVFHSIAICLSHRCRFPFSLRVFICALWNWCIPNWLKRLKVIKKGNFSCMFVKGRDVSWTRLLLKREHRNLLLQIHVYFRDSLYNSQSQRLSRTFEWPKQFYSWQIDQKIAINRQITATKWMNYSTNNAIIKQTKLNWNDDRKIVIDSI